MVSLAQVGLAAARPLALPHPGKGLSLDVAFALLASPFLIAKASERFSSKHKYGIHADNIDIAMEGIFREWYGVTGVLVPVELKQGESALKSLEGLKARTGCSLEEAASCVLAKYAEVAVQSAEPSELQQITNKVFAELKRGLSVMERTLNPSPKEIN